MTRSRTITSLLALVSVCALIAACGSSSGSGKGDYTTKLQMGTGSVGGTYYPLGGEIATMLTKNADVKDLNVSAVETGASVENMAKIGAGKLQLAMTINGTAREAYDGTGEFDGKTVENFGFIGQIYPEVLHVVTLESSGIESISDLKGKKVAIGPPGSGTSIIAQKTLAAYGIEKGDYDAQQEDFGDASDKLQNKNIDASFGVLGAPAADIDELQASTKDVRYLEIDGDALKKLTGDDSEYNSFKIPQDSYDWLDHDVQTIAASAVLVASTDQVSKETGYEITKTLFENNDKISHQQAEYTTKDRALTGRLGLPLHPGAKQYFEEEGLLDDE